MRRILLLLYPAPWRKEYGEEFADVLASQRVGVRMIADVAGSAALQRLRCVPLWLMCGAFLFALELYRLFSPLSLPVLRESDPKDVILLMTALWIAVRKGSSLGAAVAGTARAGLLGIMPCFILFAVLNVKAGVPFFFGFQHGLAVIVVVAYSAFLGVIGGYCGRLIARP